VSETAVTDFEDLLALLDEHGVRALIVGGMAFIYHAKPRYTKDLDLWLDPAPDNVAAANRALAELGRPAFLNPDDPTEILQLGVAPNRIDILRTLGEASFQKAWARRIEGRHGRAPANWVDLDTLIAIKSAIDHPRHGEDVRVLEMVRDRRRNG
jgi:hypothetical protein